MMCVQYIGACSLHWGGGGGYAECSGSAQHIGGYHDSLFEAIQSTMTFTADIQRSALFKTIYSGPNELGNPQYTRDSLPHVIMVVLQCTYLPSNVLCIVPQCTEHLPVYSIIAPSPPMYSMIAPQCTMGGSLMH